MDSDDENEKCANGIYTNLTMCPHHHLFRYPSIWQKSIYSLKMNEHHKINILLREISVCLFTNEGEKIVWPNAHH